MPAHLDSFRCELCHRRYLAVTEKKASSDTEQPARCVCGGKLRSVILDAGYYEAVPRALDIDIAPTKPAPEPEQFPAPPAAEKQEADLGYGKSHGYGPSHGGPTGPGDAPAGETDANVRK